MKLSAVLSLFLAFCGVAHAEDVTLFSDPQNGIYWYLSKSEYSRMKKWDDQKDSLPVPIEKIISLATAHAREKTGNSALDVSRFSLTRKTVAENKWYYIVTLDQQPPLQDAIEHLKTVFNVVVLPDGKIVGPRSERPDDPFIP